MSLFFKKEKILKKNWYDYQVYHSILDTALSLSSDGMTTPRYWIILKSIYLNLKKIEIAKFLLKKNISAVVSSHNVYFVKSFNSIFRKNNIPVYCQAVSNIYKQPKNKDENWNILHNNNLRKKILNKVSNPYVNNYWNKKFSGKGDYFDSNLAYKKKKIYNGIKNVVMLHIFRDSPYLALDKTRIFINYIDWIDYTIKIISKSKERWHLKIHPNSKNWGENPLVLVNKLLKKNKAENIKILNDGNLKLMNHLKKVVTYSGSASYEAISL